MGIYDEIAKQCQSVAILCRCSDRSDMLLDDSGNDPCGDAAFFVQMGNDETDIILSPGPAPVIAGVGDGVGAVAEADIHNAFIDMGDFSCILALDTAFAEIIIPVVTCYTLDVGLDPDLLRIGTINFQYTHQHMISHGETVIGVADPRMTRSDTAITRACTTRPAQMRY